MLVLDIKLLQAVGRLSVSSNLITLTHLHLSILRLSPKQSKLGDISQLLINSPHNKGSNFIVRKQETIILFLMFAENGTTDAEPIHRFTKSDVDLLLLNPAG